MVDDRDASALLATSSSTPDSNSSDENDTDRTSKAGSPGGMMMTVQRESRRRRRRRRVASSKTDHGDLWLLRLGARQLSAPRRKAPHIVELARHCPRALTQARSVVEILSELHHASHVTLAESKHMRAASTL